MAGLSRREMLQGSVLLVGATASVGATSPTSPSAIPSFHYDHVLGTSLDVWATGAAIESVEAIVLDEIERLRRVFSAYDPESELSRLNRATEPMMVSADVAAVLREYRKWHRLTTGALSPTLTRHLGFVLDDASRTVRRTTGTSLNLNAVAKGYVLSQTADRVRSLFPEIRSLVVNLGGDLAIRGSELVGVQNPHRPAENSPLLTAVRVRDAGIATSGTYQRGTHLIDPRTGRPATSVAGATVIAPTSVVANLLATSLCVLGPVEGLRLIASVPGAECLIVGADGRQHRSGGFGRIEVPCLMTQEPKPAAAEDKGWIEANQVAISLELPKPTTGRAIRRPYVAIWIEDAEGKTVRSLAVWGNSSKWINTLTNWWKIGRADGELVKAVSRATRAPGKYEVVWDGKDEKGKLVAQGAYVIKVEVHREHGKHVIQTGKIACAADETKVTLDKNDETEATLVQYAKKK